MATAITFDSNNLQTNNIQTADILHEQYPTKYAPVYVIAHDNASKIPFQDYPNKVITIRGKVIDTSIAGLDARLDSFRAYFTGKDKNLDIGYNGVTRRYIATATAISIDRPGGLAYADFEIEFTATQPFGQDTGNTTALSASGRTLGTYTDAYTFLGTAPSQLPLITITFSVLTGGTNQSLTLTNGGNGQGITITRTWAATDVVTIDCLNKTVQVNGADVAFTGAFPEFPPGAQNFSYVDTFTTRTFAITVTYKVMYL
jgi:hypothetical protein